MSGKKSTMVVIVGTIHLGGKQFHSYTKALRQIITEVSPDVICGEVSPEQLSGKKTLNSKPEYQEVIMPWSRQNGIEVIPLEPGDSHPIRRNFAEKEKERWNRVKSGEFGSHLADYHDKLWDRISRNMEETLSNPCGFENLQRREFDLYFSDLSYFYDEFFLPEFAALQKQWDKYFLSRIYRAIKDNANSKILVTIGLRHKNWLWQRLESRDNIVLYNLQSFSDRKRKK